MISKQIWTQNTVVLRPSWANYRILKCFVSFVTNLLKDSILPTQLINEHQPPVHAAGRLQAKTIFIKTALLGVLVLIETTVKIHLGMQAIQVRESIYCKVRAQKRSKSIILSLFSDSLFNAQNTYVS